MCCQGRPENEEGKGRGGGGGWEGVGRATYTQGRTEIFSLIKETGSVSRCGGDDNTKPGMAGRQGGRQGKSGSFTDPRACRRRSSRCQRLPRCSSPLPPPQF
eukprot:Sspe_Gene.113556::Locus_98202_Transcript_1_1_Confidence_1.000_Length_421::g.113556::m.113556